MTPLPVDATFQRLVYTRIGREIPGAIPGEPSLANSQTVLARTGLSRYRADWGRLTGGGSRLHIKTPTSGPSGDQSQRRVLGSEFWVRSEFGSVLFGSVRFPVALLRSSFCLSR